MEQNPTFHYYYRVESLARPIPSRCKRDKGTDRYIHIVAFNDPKDHEQMIRNYLKYHCRVDPDDPDSQLRGLNTDNHICADAILTYYLGAKINRIIHADRTVPADDIPAGAPIFNTDTSAIWLVSREENVRA
jgi:hypothetical protein